MDISTLKFDEQGLIPGIVQDLYGGADPAHRLNVRLVTELAWHGLFIRHLLRRPERAELDSFVPDWTVINCPSFRAVPARHGCRSETTSFLRHICR